MGADERVEAPMSVIPLLAVQEKSNDGFLSSFGATPVDEGGAFYYGVVLLRATPTETRRIIDPQNEHAPTTNSHRGETISRGINGCHAVDPCIHVAAVKIREA
jgi:hypothetical protein